MAPEPHLAEPSTRRRLPQPPIWMVIVIACAILYAMAAAFHASDATRNEARDAAAEAKHLAFEKKLMAIATPAAFQAQCGKASHIEHLGPPAYERGTTRLIYDEGQGETLRAYFGSGTVGFDHLLNGRRYIPSGAPGSQDEEVLAEIGCHLP